MIEILKITLENPMDLILAHKKATKLSERLGLTMSTSATFSTAVSEISREVIDRTDSGVLIFGLIKEDLRYSLAAKLRFDKSVTIIPSDAGYQYAIKLLPQVTQYQDKNFEVIELKMGLPRSNKITPERLSVIKNTFATEPPYTAYEAIKLKNLELHELAEGTQEELQRSLLDNEQKIEFISIASHELKTPVTIIKAFAQLALAAGEEECSPNIKKHLTRIEAQSVKLTTLIQQLMDVSKIERGKLDYSLSKIGFNAYMFDTIDMIKHTVPEHIVELTLNEDVFVNIDKIRMEQVLTNLISNAAKYSKSGTRINVNCSIEESFLIISVTDRGIGMPKDSLSQIFDKFHRNSEVVYRFAGLGMGLYITAKIIKEHDGDIWVDSEEGKGSTFYISLPIFEAA